MKNNKLMYEIMNPDSEKEKEEELKMKELLEFNIEIEWWSYKEIFIFYIYG